ncbi:MAG: FliA/WhiG family RNA polymerase sigma factor [Oscillospiraceae bacterium]|nr:FliA/WhiG family RNA polymerase sigma factor [Oscillospiraceae bacterium]
MREEYGSAALKDKSTEELFEEYRRTRSKALRNEIVLRSMGIVRYAALSTRNMYRKYSETEDIVNEATIALMYAVDSFDPSKNTKFETYASIRVRGAIIDYIRRQDIIPRTVRKFAKEYDTAYTRLYEKLDREPLPEELAAELNVPVSKLDSMAAQTAAANALSFEEIVFDSGVDIPDTNGGSMAGWEPEKRLLNGEMRDILASAIDKLKEKERLVVTLYYYEKLKYSDIAGVIGVSESRVCQIHSAAVIHLKDALKEYL